MGTPAATCSCSATTDAPPPPPPAMYAPPPVLAPPSAVAPTNQPMYVAERPPEQKSESLAILLSVGTTVAGVATIALAVDSQDESQAILGLGMALAGPSLGHLYAGELGHAVLFTGLRVGGLALAANALSQGDSDNEIIAAIGLSIAGAATLYDLIDAPRAIGRYNREGGLLIRRMRR